jgi:hypothetical protein
MRIGSGYELAKQKLPNDGQVRSIASWLVTAWFLLWNVAGFDKSLLKVHATSPCQNG